MQTEVSDILYEILNAVNGSPLWHKITNMLGKVITETTPKNGEDFLSLWLIYFLKKLTDQELESLCMYYDSFSLETLREISSEITFRYIATHHDLQGREDNAVVAQTIITEREKNEQTATTIIPDSVIVVLARTLEYYESF